MEKGFSKSTACIYKYYLNNPENYNNIYNYIKNNYNPNALYKKINSREEAESIIKINHKNLDMDAIHCYCAPLLSRYESINSALRGQWDYSYHGNEEAKQEYLSIAKKISQSIEQNEEEHESLFVYRGVDLNAFKGYGIDSINDLMTMQGKYMYDEAFQSTALLEEKCYFNKKDEYGSVKNIKIVGCVPQEFKEGLYLDRDISTTPDIYDPGEYLINSGTLSYVAHIDINGDTATMYVIYIPKEIWDLDYKKYREESQSKSM